LATALFRYPAGWRISWHSGLYNAALRKCAAVSIPGCIAAFHSRRHVGRSIRRPLDPLAARSAGRSIRRPLAAAAARRRCWPPPPFHAKGMKVLTNT